MLVETKKSIDNCREQTVRELLGIWVRRGVDSAQVARGTRPIPQTEFLSKLNSIHFKDEFIILHFRSLVRGEDLYLKALPDAGPDGLVHCLQPDGHHPEVEPQNFDLTSIMIEDGRELLIASVSAWRKGRLGFEVKLSSVCLFVTERHTRRYNCSGVTADLIQSSVNASGEVYDFNAEGFRLNLALGSRDSGRSLDPELPMFVTLRRNNDIVFSGVCKCIRERAWVQDWQVVIMSVEDKIRRFGKKRIRNPRHRLSAPPTIVFDHPVLGRPMNFDVYDISTSGFSVYEKPEDSLLMQGMNIAQLHLAFFGQAAIKCAAKVVYRLEESKNGVRCGLSIVDMDIDAYSRLNHILANHLDPCIHVSAAVNVDSLWEFFFDSGFIYPSKYQSIKTHREGYKKTYEKLYQECPGIARHFTYEKNGQLYAHISMVRAYEKSWMVQHHAARSMAGRKTGLEVLKHFMHFLFDMYRLPSLKFDYLMCYFRSDNKFPCSVFGRYARSLKDPRCCSLDPFAFRVHSELILNSGFSGEGHLEEISESEWMEVRRFYGVHSGGLFLDAIGWGGKQRNGMSSLEQEYLRLGFTREFRGFSLKRDGSLEAVLLLNRSEPGLNLSDILNSITVLIVRSESLPWSVLSNVINRLAAEHGMREFPVLIYPYDYVQTNKIRYDKLYYVWVHNARFMSRFMEYMYEKYRAVYLDWRDGFNFQSESDGGPT